MSTMYCISSLRAPWDRELAGGQEYCALRFLSSLRVAPHERSSRIRTARRSLSALLPLSVVSAVGLARSLTKSTSEVAEEKNASE